MIRGADLAVHGAARVHPLTGRGAAIDDACVRIQGGVILSVLPRASCTCLTAGIEVVDAAGLTAIPGFVDGHRHTWQTAFRQSLSGLPISEYGRVMLGRYAPAFEPEDTYLGTLLGALTALDSGTTTIVDWSHALNSPAHADAALEALATSGVRAQFAYGIPRDGGTSWSKDSALPHPRDLARVHAGLGTGSRVTAALAARGPEMSTREVTCGDVEFARELGVRISMHVGIGDLGPRVQAVRRLAEWGLLGDDMTFIHLNSTTDDELALIKDAGAGTCIGPATEMLMAEVGWPVTGRLLDHELRPALSVDTETATSGSMFDQLRAVLSGLPAENGDRGFDPYDALDLATASGARAIGLGDTAGRLVPGAAGDVVLVDTAAVNLAPALDDVASIVLAGHPGNVRVVVVDGIVRKREGRLVGHDLAGLAERSRASAERIRTTTRLASSLGLPEGHRP